MKKTALLALLLFTLQTASAQGGGFRELVDYGFESLRYQQDSLMMVDPKGDAYLIRQIDTIPPKLLSYFFHRSLPQAVTERDKKSGAEPFTIGRTLPIDNERLMNSCAAIMRAHFPDIVPVMGEEHRWSPEASEYLRTGFWHRVRLHADGRQKDFPAPILGRSKLFICLACGWTSRFCATGTEEALRQRILSYPDRNVTPHQLFEDSYVLNGGDIYLTFLTCENVLAGIPQRWERDSDPIQRKLAYIRHDSSENGDNYGAWYHFFGAALYGMLRSGFKSLVAVDTESVGSFFMEGPDPQEDLINHYGALFGISFRKMLEDASWIFQPAPGTRTDYLLPKPSNL